MLMVIREKPSGVLSVGGTDYLGIRKKNPVLLIKNRFNKKFPYKLNDSIYQK